MCPAPSGVAPTRLPVGRAGVGSQFGCGVARGAKARRGAGGKRRGLRRLGLRSTADLECALPAPTSPTQRSPHRGPEALGRGLWGALGHRWARSQGPGGAREFKGKRARVAGQEALGLPVTPSAI